LIFSSGLKVFMILKLFEKRLFKNSFSV